MVAPFLIAAGVSLAVGIGTSLAVNALTPAQKIQTGKLNDLSVPKSSYGAVIPQCWGTLKLAGNMLWSAPLTEVTRTRRQGGKGGPRVENEETSYYGSFAVMFAYTPNRSAEALNRIWLNGKLVFDGTSTDPEVSAASAQFLANHVRFYTGASDQPVDPMLQNKTPIQSYDYGLPHDPTERAIALGSLGLPPDLNHIPAYRYICYIVFEDLPLRDYNSQLPVVKAEINFNSNNTLETIATDICNQSSIYNIDTTEIANIPVEGFYLDTVTTGSDALTTLQQAYFFDIIFSGDTLKFVPETTTRIVTSIPLTDLAAHSGGSNRPAPFELPKPDPESLPESVEVTFLDIEGDYETGNVIARSQVASSKKKETFNFPIAMTSDTAQAIADSLLHRLYLRAIQPQSLTLSRKYCNVEPGDWIEIDFYGEPYQLQITKMQIGANVLIKLDAVVVEAANLTQISQPVTPIPTGGYNQPVTTSNFNLPQGATNLEIMDINLISDSDEDNGLYVAANGNSASWREASIYVSNDDVSYYFTGTTVTEGTIGNLSSSLDNSSTSFTVNLNSGQFESISNADFDNGINRILVGNEILQFQNAVLNSNSWELSNLRRGLRGTESFIDSHSIGDRVVLLTGNGATRERISGSVGDLGQIRYFKAPSGGQSLDAATAIPVTIEGNALKPYSPVNIAATVDNIGNITITWDRRDRRAGDATTFDNLPLSEQEEKWEIEILDSSNSVVRIEITFINSFNYTALQQNTDFSGVLNSISVNVYQISATIGRGYRANATLTPSLFQPDPVITDIYPNPANINDLITIEGTGLNQIAAVFFRDFIPEAQDLTILSDNEITFKFTHKPFRGQTHPINFITGSNAFIDPSLIDVFTDTLLTISSSGNGSGFTGFVIVTSSRSLEDDDFGKILILDTTVNDADIELTLDESILTNTENFNFSAIKLGQHEGIFLDNGSNQLIATDNKLIEDRSGASWFLQLPNIWYGLGALGGVDLSDYMLKTVYDPDGDGVIQASVDTSDFMLKRVYDRDGDGFADNNIDLSPYITAVDAANTYMRSSDYVEQGLIKKELIPPTVYVYDRTQDNNTNYTIAPTDLKKEFQLSSQTKNILIPDSNNGFIDGWDCLITLVGTGGNVSIKRANNTRNGLLFSGGTNFTQLKTQGTVSIRHLSNNIWFINGYLEEA